MGLIRTRLHSSTKENEALVNYDWIGGAFLGNTKTTFLFLGEAVRQSFLRISNLSGSSLLSQYDNP